MKRRALLVLLVMVMLLCLPGCGGELRAVERCAEQYLHTFRTEGIEKAVEYCHFEATELYSPDDHRTLYVRSGCAIQDYRIQHIDRINDGLYALKLELQDAGGQWKTVYNFVGRINGAYRYINGVSHVPAAISTLSRRGGWDKAFAAMLRLCIDYGKSGTRGVPLLPYDREGGEKQMTD